MKNAEKKQEDKHLLYAGGIAGIIATLCCVGPVVLVLVGLAGVSTALSIGKLTLLFTTLAFLFFGTAVLFYLKKRKCCSPAGVKEHWKLILLSLVVLAVVLLFLKYGLAPLLARAAYR